MISSSANFSNKKISTPSAWKPTVITQKKSIRILKDLKREFNKDKVCLSCKNILVYNNKSLLFECNNSCCLNPKPMLGIFEKGKMSDDELTIMIGMIVDLEHISEIQRKLNRSINIIKRYRNLLIKYVNWSKYQLDSQTIGLNEIYSDFSWSFLE